MGQQPLLHWTGRCDLDPELLEVYKTADEWERVRTILARDVDSHDFTCFTCCIFLTLGFQTVRLYKASADDFDGSVLYFENNEHLLSRVGRADAEKFGCWFALDVPDDVDDEDHNFDNATLRMHSFVTYPDGTG